ncbi:hypothetical protein Unana1_00404 [Umbelopsis nana]
MADLSDGEHTIPAILTQYPNSGTPENLKVAEGTVIVTREAKLDTHWMVPEEKVGVHLYVKDYSIQADGAAIQPNLKSVSFTDEVRSWLNELERHLSSISGPNRIKKPPTLDILRKSLTQKSASENTPTAVEDGNMETDDDDDAAILVSIGKEDSTNGDDEQGELNQLNQQIKRAKLTSEEPHQKACTTDTEPANNFGWDSCDYVMDVECIIPEDQMHILNNLDGWIPSSKKVPPVAVPTKPVSTQATPGGQASVGHSMERPTSALLELVAQRREPSVVSGTTPLMRLTKNGLVELPCDVECHPLPEFRDSSDVDMDRSMDLQTLVKQCMSQRDSLFKSFTPTNSFTIL